jgi:malate permease and related proteins
VDTSSINGRLFKCAFSFRNFFGVYYAAKGTAGLKMAIVSVLKMPPTYAVLVALPMNLGGVTVPENLMNSVDLLAAATVPVVMVVLGKQLAGIPLQNLEWLKVSYRQPYVLLVRH